LRLASLGEKTLEPLLKRPDLYCRLRALDLDQAEPRQVLRLMKTPGLALHTLLAEHAEDGSGWDGTLRQMSKLPALESLVELGLAPGTRSNPPTPAALRALLRSPHFLQLERLHLPFSCLDDESAHALGYAAAFARLTHLDLGCAEISLAGWQDIINGPNLR